MTDLPTFHTARLIVRPRQLSDLTSCLRMDRDAEVTKFIPGPWKDPKRHQAFVKERIENDFGPGLGYWSVFDRQNPQKFLGWILLIPCEGSRSEIEIGWRFVREAWGKGYATEAAKHVLAHAFQTVGLKRIVADIDPRNKRSINVATKIGMVDELIYGHDEIRWRRFVVTPESFRANLSRQS